MEASLILPLELTAMAAWPQAEVEAALIRQAGAVVAELQDNPPFVDLSPGELDQAGQIAGERLLAAIDALPNGTDLLLAHGDAVNAAPVDLCAVHQVMLRTALAIEGADGDLVVRYLVTDDWAN
jgi:hypothetical protein